MFKRIEMLNVQRGDGTGIIIMKGSGKRFCIYTDWTAPNY